MITKGMKLRTSRKILHWVQAFSSKKGIMLSQFQISKREKTVHCMRTKRTKTRDYKRKESIANWGIKGGMLVNFDLLLLNQAWILDLVLVMTSCWRPGPLRIDQGYHLYIGNSIRKRSATNCIVESEI